MNKEYMIMDISEGSHNHFGKIIIVKANPIETTAFGMKQYSELIGLDTDYFFFPDESPLIKDILSIARRRDVWAPDEDEYTIESVNDENNKKKINVYFHDSLYDVEEDDDECMKYYCTEYSLNQRNFNRLKKEEEWKFTTEYIETPYGDMFLESYMKVNQGPLVGVQFEVDGTLDLSNIDESLDYVDIKAVAVMRRPHNVWLWVYMFDESHNNVITFCGHDGIDGFAAYVRLLDEL